MPVDYAKLRKFVVRLGEKSRDPVTTATFEQTVMSYVRIIATVNAVKTDVDVPADVLSDLVRAYRKAGGKIKDAPGTPLRLHLAGCK